MLSSHFTDEAWGGDADTQRGVPPQGAALSPLSTARRSGGALKVELLLRTRERWPGKTFQTLAKSRQLGSESMIRCKVTCPGDP